jgi:hypothetical protein
MKTWYAKFKISSALDEAKPSVSQPPVASAELHQFAQSLRQLDRELRVSQPTATMPTGLHASVMRAVRETARERATTAEPQRATFKLAWLAAPALAVIVLVGLLARSVFHQPQVEVQPVLQPSSDHGSAGVAANAPAPTFATTASASLDLSGAVARVAPTALAPLQQELEFVRQDVRKASEVIFAALP